MLKIGSHSVRIDRKLAEGGFADIFRVNDCSTFSQNMPYALKRMYIPAENGSLVRQAYEQEINILQSIIDCPNIIKIIGFEENA